MGKMNAEIRDYTIEKQIIGCDLVGGKICLDTPSYDHLPNHDGHNGMHF